MKSVRYAWIIMPSSKVLPRSSSERRESIARYRREQVPGVAVTLVPYGEQHIDAVCRLRNAERARFQLNQETLLTPEKQRIWSAGYDARSGDLYWVIQAPDGRIVGTIALYDIDAEGTCAELGRFVIDEDVNAQAPYALEAERAVLRIAFAELGMARVTTLVRHENEDRNAMNARLGFLPSGARDVRGVLYGEYDLEPDRFDEASRPSKPPKKRR